MTPAPSETAELIIRLRQQLILAQVRIMELEDEHDRLAPRLAEIEGLLAAAQRLAEPLWLQPKRRWTNSAPKSPR
jgi:hypothetical protein